MAVADPDCRSLPMAAADRCRWPLPIVQLLLVGHPGVGTEGSSTEPTIAAAQATVYTPPPRIMAKAFSEVNEDKLDAEWARLPVQPWELNHQCVRQGRWHNRLQHAVVTAA